jgi:hypothetical protein
MAGQNWIAAFPDARAHLTPHLTARSGRAPVSLACAVNAA